MRQVRLCSSLSWGAGFSLESTQGIGSTKLHARGAGFSLETTQGIVKWGGLPGPLRCGMGCHAWGHPQRRAHAAAKRITPCVSVAAATA